MMFGSILVLFVLPWLDTSPVRSARVPADLQVARSGCCVVDCVVLGWVGAHRPEGIWVVLGRVATLYYFLHFLVILPMLGKFERPLPLPREHQPRRCSKRRRAAARGRRCQADGEGLMRTLRSRRCSLRPARRPAGAAQRSRGRRAAAAAALVASTARSAPSTAPPLQRGFQVYKEVCSACHSLKLLHYRNLDGHRLHRGPDQGDRRRRVTVADGPNDEGEIDRAARRAVRPFQVAVRRTSRPPRAANNGALPPDLSLIVKAREGGAGLRLRLLTGYGDPPAGHEDGRRDELQQVLPRPSDRHAAAAAATDQVTYADGTKATVEQMAHDVVDLPGLGGRARDGGAQAASA